MWWLICCLRRMSIISKKFWRLPLFQLHFPSLFVYHPMEAVTSLLSLYQRIFEECGGIGLYSLNSKQLSFSRYIQKNTFFVQMLWFVQLNRFYSRYMEMLIRITKHWGMAILKIVRNRYNDNDTTSAHHWALQPKFEINALNTGSRN